jgi:DNA-binding FadR family transcriptional regulator
MVIPTMASFQSIKLNRVSHQVAEQIKKLVLEGSLKPGERLPSERELARMINVGRLSLREGLRILESAGILETRYGVNSGTYVSEVGVDELTAKFSDCLRLSHVSLNQLIEARFEVSSIIIKYFIERGKEEDLRKLEDCIKEIEAQIASGSRTRESSIHFHELIAQASRNPVFIMLHNAVMDMMREFLQRFDSPPGHSKRVLANNKKILKYLKERDFEKASQAMKNHLIYVRRMLSLGLPGIKVGSRTNSKRFQSLKEWTSL